MVRLLHLMRLGPIDTTKPRPKPGKESHMNERKGWPPIVWIPVLIVVGIIVAFAVGGVPR